MCGVGSGKSYAFRICFWPSPDVSDLMRSRMCVQMPLRRAQMRSDESQALTGAVVCLQRRRASTGLTARHTGFCVRSRIIAHPRSCKPAQDVLEPLTGVWRLFPRNLSAESEKHCSCPSPHGWVKNFQASHARPTPFVGVKFPRPLSARPTPSRGVKNLGVDRARPTLMRVQMGEVCRCFHTRGLPHARVRFSSHLYRRGPPH